VALQAYYASSQGRVVATGDPWFQPAVWPLTLHAGAFADESELATVTRDGSMVLYWAGRQVADDLERRDPDLDLTLVPSAMTCAGLAAAAMLPGYVLHYGLVRHPASPPSGHLEPHREAWLPSRLLAALRIYAERALLPAYGQWAAATLLHCQATLQQLGWSAESTAVEMYQGAACFLDTVFSQSPHIMQLEPAPWSGKRDVLYSMAASAAVVQGCEAAAKCKRAATTLQLSCCLFMWPMVSIVAFLCEFAGLLACFPNHNYCSLQERSRWHVPHRCIDWLWPLLQGLQACEQSVLRADVACDDILLSKVGLPCFAVSRS